MKALKAIIKTDIDIEQEWLDEVLQYRKIDFVIEKTDLNIIPTWNPYHRFIEIDWKWFKSLFGRRKADIYCYCTSSKNLTDAHVTKYLGLYNHLDGDGVHDFWFGVPDKLQNKAKNNGFNTNFTWLFLHELSHGEELSKGQRDRTHEMENQGRLKELLALNKPDEVTVPVENEKVKSLMATYITLMQQYLGLLLKGRYQKPLPNHWGKVTQKFTAYAPEIYKYGYHTGTDFAAPLNTPILAPYDGEITRSGYSSTLGNWCEFKFDSHYMIALHLREKPLLGRRAKGDPVGFVGDTGFIMGVHAHLEIWTQPMDRNVIKSKEAIMRNMRDIKSIIF
jgi:hypothetical protein